MYRIISFGFKHGRPDDMLSVDVRQLINPHSNLRLRPLTGMHPDVQAFVKKDPQFEKHFAEASAKVKSAKRLAVGCIGGRHRSVAMVELLAKSLRAEGHDVQVIHRELSK